MKSFKKKKDHYYLVIRLETIIPTVSHNIERRLHYCTFDVTERIFDYVRRTSSSHSLSDCATTYKSYFLALS
jgi:hypothetical protein